MSLKGMIDDARKKAAGAAGGAIAGLAQEATRLGMADAAARLSQARTGLDTDVFRLIVVGRFKNGKSTLLNALLGRLTHAVPDLKGRGPMPTDDLPCTATLTSIRYAARPYVKLWRFDGTSETWDLARYLKESTVKGDEAQNQQFFAAVREFEVGFPAELCQSGVTLLDSPGMDDVPQRTAVTTQAIRECDAAVVVYRHDVFAGQSEREFVTENLHNAGIRVFTVINLWGGRAADDRLRGLVWNRLVKDMHPGQPAFAGQDLAARDIYFVDVRAAEKAKLAGDEAAARASGMTALEDRIGAFLVADRHAAQVARWAAAADGVAANLGQQVGLRQAGLRQDQARLQHAADLIAPKLAAVEARRDRLPKLFERAAADAQQALRLSFRALVDDLRADLPGLLAAEPLPSLQTLGGKAAAVLNSKKLAGEVMGVCGRLVTARFEQWGNGPAGARRATGPVFDRLWDDIRQEVDTIERELQDVKFDLTGWQPAGVATPGASMADRVLSGLAGVILLNPVVAAGGGVGGWRAALGAVGGTLAAKLLLTTVGFAWTGPFFPVVIASAAAAAVLGGTVGLERRIKDVALKAIVDGTDGKGKPLVGPDGRPTGGLSAAPTALGPAIDAQTRESFADLEERVMASVAAEIRGDEENIRRVIDEGKRDQAEKARALAVLEDVGRKVAAHRQALKDALTPA